MAQPKIAPLSAWSRGQALAMAAALLRCAEWHAAWPVALCAALSFSCLIWLGRSSFTPSGRFGVANAITVLRLFLMLALAAPPRTLPPLRALGLVAVVLSLDLLDGWCARRFGDASPFGAHFDMETDALLVLLLTLRLWLAEGFGAWVLWAGLLRYLYVLWLWLWPGTGREAPRSLFGRLAFLLLMLGLCCGLVLPGAWGMSGVALGTLIVTASFARSGYFSRLAT